MNNKSCLDFSSELLIERAEKVEEIIENFFVDDSGKIITSLNKENMRPFEAGFFNNKNHIIVPGYEDMDYSDFVSYENVGMVSGAFLAAMCWKHKATGNEGALKKARRTYHGLRALYELSQEVAPGFFCKCWGNRLTDELSSDQYIYTMTCLDLYSQIATETEKKEIAEMIGTMALFWLDRDYSYKYYGRPMQWQRCRFPGFMALAYHHTGERLFLEELKKLLSLDEVINAVPFGGDFKQNLINLKTRPLSKFEENLPKNLRVTSLNSEKTLSGFLSFEPVLRYNGINKKFYLEMTERLLDYGCRGVSPDGSGYLNVYVDLNDGHIQEVDKILNQDYSSTFLNWKFFSHIAPVRHGTMATCMFARAAVGIHKYLPGNNALSFAKRILNKVDINHFTWYEDPKDTLPAELKWMTMLYSGEAITHWLWTYWEARNVEKNV